MERRMAKINWTRVLLGGLLAGVIINVFEFVTNGVFVAAEWKAMMKALGRTTVPSAGGAVIFLIWGFLSGIGAIWLYAAARPRFGPGVKTAALTGFAFWALTTGLCSLDEARVGLYRPRLQGHGARSRGRSGCWERPKGRRIVRAAGLTAATPRHCG
jgi:hypothetical protein